jgi:pimeloyl-ACP methyl ester carboxylesterase
LLLASLLLLLLLSPGALASALNWYRANTQPRHFGSTAPQPANKLISCPVLGVWSSADTALLERQMCASSAYVAPGCWQYERIEGVGHWIARDAPQQLNKLLLSFLQDRELQLAKL